MKLLVSYAPVFYDSMKALRLKRFSANGTFAGKEFGVTKVNMGFYICPINQ